MFRRKLERDTKSMILEIILKCIYYPGVKTAIARNATLCYNGL